MLGRTFAHGRIPRGSLEPRRSRSPRSRFGRNAGRRVVGLQEDGEDGEGVLPGFRQDAVVADWRGLRLHQRLQRAARGHGGPGVRQRHGSGQLGMVHLARLHLGAPVLHPDLSPQPSDHGPGAAGTAVWSALRRLLQLDHAVRLCVHLSRYHPLWQQPRPGGNHGDGLLRHPLGDGAAGRHLHGEGRLGVGHVDGRPPVPLAGWRRLVALLLVSPPNPGGLERHAGRQPGAVPPLPSARRSRGALSEPAGRVAGGVPLLPGDQPGDDPAGTVRPVHVGRHDGHHLRRVHQSVEAALDVLSGVHRLPLDSPDAQGVASDEPRSRLSFRAERRSRPSGGCAALCWPGSLRR